MSKNDSVCFETHKKSSDKGVVENGYDPAKPLTNGSRSCDSNSQSPEPVISKVDEIVNENIKHEKSVAYNRTELNGPHVKLNGSHVIHKINQNHDTNMNTDMASENTASTSSDSCESSQNSLTEISESTAELSAPQTSVVKDTNVITTLPATHQTPVTMATSTSHSSHMTTSSNMMPENQMTFTPVTAIQGQIPVIHGNIVSQSCQPVPQFTTPQVDPRRPNLYACPIHQQINVPPNASTSPLQTSTTPPLSDNTGPSTNQSGTNNGNQGAHHQHVVHVHIQPGETLTVQYEDQLQRVQDDVECDCRSDVMIKPMKCAADWEAYDPTPPVMCSVCIDTIEEYTGYAQGYGTNGYSQTGYNVYGYNNVYANGYNGMGYNMADFTGPAMIRMVSNNGPRQPMRMQLPPGHLVQQIADENGILTHVILSPQPPTMMGNPIPGGPNNAPQYYQPYGGPYTNHPQYPSPHHHTHGPPTPGPRNNQSHIPHQHGTPPPPTNSNNHGPAYSQGPSPPLNSMDDRATRQRNRMRKKHQVRESEGYYNRDRGPRRTNQKGTNEVESSTQSNSINNVSHPPPPEDQAELEEERRILQARLSNMPPPKVSGIVSRSAVIHLSPPDCDNKEFYYDPAEFCYELSLCEKVKDGKYKTVYNGDATEITLKDLKPATEYHVKVCTILDDMRGSTTEAISFKTLSCEPDQPSPPTIVQKSKTYITLKWKTASENGSKISAYVLECESGDGSGKFDEVYNGLQKQHKITRLTASSKYTFRLAAINATGKSAYSECVTYCTSGSPPSQPDPPMLSECFVTELVLSWFKRPNDDEFVLQYEDPEAGHGFLNVYNGPSLSYRLGSLVRNKDYKFRLGAKNDEGTSKWSDIVSYRTKPSIPDSPFKPQIKGKIYAHSFRVTWDPPRDDGGSDITKYIVELSDGKDYETLYEGSEREHTCDRLTPGHTYRVRVAAVSAGGRSEFSDVCIATTQAIPPGQCSVPKLQGKPKATSLHLRWAYPELNGGSQVTEFAAQMILPDNTSREVYKGRDLDCIVAGLQPGRPYLFQVRAFNRAGGGPWSEPLEVVSGAGVPDPPKMPVCTCRSSHSVLIGWEGPVNNGATITDYRLEWQLKSDQDFSQLYYGPNTNFEVKGLNPASTYTFRVQAINSAGAGLYSPAASCVTPPSSPSPVISIRPTPTANSVHLEWKAPNCNGSEIHSYNLDIGDKQLICVSAITEHVIEDLHPDTTYRLRIQAVNDIGVGAFSSPVKFTTRSLPPRPPRLECNGVAPASLKLKWGDGRNFDLKTFTLEMEKNDGNFQEVYKGQSYFIKVNRLTELTSYDFRIYATNEAGNGPYSDIHTFTTSKAPPPSLRSPKVDHITRSSCTVEWQSCKPMGEDRILYLLQLQGRDQEFKQIYKGRETSYVLESLHTKTDYNIRVCAIRVSSDETELFGAFSPCQSFSTLSPEPVKTVSSHSAEQKAAQVKPWTDEQLSAIVVAVVLAIGILIAFIVQLVFFRS